MKKITSIFAAILLMGTVLFFACKKDEPAPVVDNCSTLATTLKPEIDAVIAAYAAYTVPGGSGLTTANCMALKKAATTLKTKASICPAVLAQFNTYIIAGDALNCTAP